MAMVKRSSDNLTVSLPSSSSSGIKRKQIVLEEDDFIAAIDTIIERDFFPDIYHMKREMKKFTNPLGVQDTPKAFGMPGRLVPTPSTFETPTFTESEELDIRMATDAGDVDNQSQSEEPKIKTHLSLNVFLSNYTSEDNSSFDDIMKEAEKRHRIKYPWLYLDEEKANKAVRDALTLPSIEKQAIENGSNKHQQLLTWPYKNNNSVMFIPDTLPLTEKDFAGYKGPTVVHRNTRFNKHPFNENLNEAVLAEAALMNSKEKEGRIGIDGKELVPDGPRVGGYSFVSMTPSPAPGVTNTPLMTWGQIEGTPYSISGGDSPLIHASSMPSGTPHFRIPDVPEREKIGQALADKISKQHRDKKRNDALKQAQYLRNSPLITSGGKTLSESLGSMSPAAQKLATIKLGINKYADRKLRESYSPCLPGSTPEKYIQSPSTPSKSAVKTPKASSDSSLTDNLLRIPRKTEKFKN